MTKPMASAASRFRVAVTGSVVVASAVFLSACNTAGGKVSLLEGAEPVERVVGPHDKVPVGGGRYQVGKPYSIGGRTYVPKEDPSLDQTGVASWYGGDYHHGTRTANGEVYDRGTLTAAHKTMPLPSYARVTNLKNGRSIVVRVNDRGPYVGNRIVDISEKTAELLDMKRHGLGQVRVQYVGRAGLAGSDARVLAATLQGPGINSGHDERTLLAQADLKPGPRQNIPAIAPTMVASAQPVPAAPPTGAAQASLYGQARSNAFAAPRAVGFAPMTDATSFELAGVDAKTMRAALAAARPAAPAPTGLASADMPRASGGPLSILPGAANSGAVASSDDDAPAAVSRSSSFVPVGRLSPGHAALARMGDGDRLAALAD